MGSDRVRQRVTATETAADIQSGRRLGAGRTLFRV
jgi:hypothetical protein